ncbi:AIM24 family protein [Deinococcus yavapaiensis]|uniref:Uncharacterized protein (AIM24 family) n=1 Tax=Deinococcus yavapaiensis KR-236 TaxID=694435 RepID=A0A318S4E2_9DEIO|nr:AIM24 family protein [Deinococcus yavapaiensis]PYE53296.1 uncharacterized protein (AIM24 family) [Deinococcus yavapaiensis KR-236]
MTGTTSTQYEILTFDTLTPTTMEAALLYHPLARTGARYRQLKITLSDSAIKLQKGVMQYVDGPITLTVESGGLGGMISRAVRNAATGDGDYKTTFTGTGDIYTEPSLQHYLPLALSGEEIVIDDNTFCACDASISVKLHVNRTLNALLGGEGWIQSKLSGTGRAMLRVPVPVAEIRVVRVRGELTLDGNLSVAHTAGLTVTAERAAKGFLASSRSGEGIVQRFRGEGSVWVMPTLPIHQALGPVRTTK